MEIDVQIKQILEEKLEHLRAFADFTMQMLDCRTEQLEELVEQREQIVRAVDLLDAKMADLCGQNPDGERLRALISGDRPEGITPAEEAVCAVVSRIRTVLSQLKESDHQAAIRLRVEQEQILKQIKNANRGVGAQAARFYASAFGGGESSTQLGKA